ncbi:hypothetical protein D3C74_246440 [compost metagenome]
MFVFAVNVRLQLTNRLRLERLLLQIDRFSVGAQRLARTRFALRNFKHLQRCFLQLDDHRRWFAAIRKRHEVLGLNRRRLGIPALQS